VRNVARTTAAGVQVSQIQKIAADTWARETDDEDSEPPTVELSQSESKSSQDAEGYLFSRSAVLGSDETVRPGRASARNAILEEKLKAITQILASYQLLEGLSQKKQEQLLNSIYQILAASEGA